MNCKIAVECADVVEFSCDVLVLKFAQSFYGADRLVATLLKPKNLEQISPRSNKYILLSSEEKLAAENVLFVGVPRLNDFDYEQIREFASKSLQILAQEMPNVSHIGMTIHGIGYGLDEKESFLAQIAGLFDSLRANTSPMSLEQITIVERNSDRAIRLQRILDETLYSKNSSQKPINVEQISTSIAISSAGIQSNVKPHVFVAMPFSKDMEDVYRYGIQNPVNAAGFLCERVDMVTFFGDILERIKSRIETASLVIADLTGANPNVYLEVGYAWGKERPTLLLSRNSEELKFDVKSQRCIIYESIGDLEVKLTGDLNILKRTVQ